MQTPSFTPPALLLAVLLALCLAAAAAPAQAPPANPPATEGPEGQSQPATTADDELLARAASLYYSTARAGLAGFDCAVHPDWRLLFASASHGSAVTGDDARVTLLNSVKITMHARLKGGSTLDWNPPANPGQPLDEGSTALLDGMHKATEQTLQGFMQFWTPFVDGSAVPSSSAGLRIARTEKGYSIQSEQSGASVTEMYDSSLVLQEFNVEMNGTKANFTPAYSSTDKGLLVNAFLAHILPAGAAPAQAQEMHVRVEYQTIDGFPVPARLNMEMVGTGTFNFVLDGCAVSRQPQ